MIIQQSVQTAAVTVQDIPKKLLAEMVIGKQLEAMVIKPAQVGELITIKMADMLINLRVPVDMLVGQKLLLELVLEQGKPTLKVTSLEQGAKPLSSLDSLVKVRSDTSTIKIGQQLPVEVVKVLTANRVLVQTVTPTPTVQLSEVKLPAQQFDIDISQLSKTYKQGDKLLMDIVNTKPLSIQLRTEQVLSREQRIIENLRQLSPQLSASVSLAKVVGAAIAQQLPSPVHHAVQQLVASTLDQSAVTEVDALKQALSKSGVFTESQLIKAPTSTQQDFKFNVTRVLNTLEAVIAQVHIELGDKQINKLPAQVQSALVAQGKSPAQLLHTLLSGKSPIPTSGVQTGLSSVTNQEQAMALIQLLTKSVPNQKKLITAPNQLTPLALSELVTLFKEVDNVHKKLQYNQLSMLKEPESSSVLATWLFDLPIKDKQNVDVLQVQIDQQTKQPDQDDQCWQVQLRLDTQNLGPVQANVTLQGEDVKVVIKAEKAESAALLEQNLPLLDTALAKLNVSVSHMSCACEQINMTTVKSTVQQASLLDVSV